MSNLSASRDLRFEADELFDEGASGSQAALMIERLTKMAQMLSDERLAIVDKVLKPMINVQNTLDELAGGMRALKEQYKKEKDKHVLGGFGFFVAANLAAMNGSEKAKDAFAGSENQEELDVKLADAIEQMLTQKLAVLLEQSAGYIKPEQVAGIGDELRFFFAGGDKRVGMVSPFVLSQQDALSVNEMVDFDDWAVSQIDTSALRFKAGELSKDTIFDIQRCQADINGDIKFRKAVEIDENGNFIDAYLNHLNARIAKFYRFQGDLKAVVIDDLLQLSRLDKELSKLAKMIKEHR